MKSFIRNKFEYNYSCNKRVITLLETHPEAYSERVQSLICHTLNAQNIWNHRIQGTKPTQGVWDIFGISQLEKLNRENHNRSIEIIEELDLRSQIIYKNTNGVQFTKSLENILYHIVNHGTYHRGQLMSELKSKGVDPIATDFIHFIAE